MQSSASADFGNVSLIPMLRSAVENDQAGVVQELLDRHPTTVITDEIIRAAIYAGSVDIFRIFLTKKITSPDEVHDRRGTALEIALSSRAPREFVIFLLEAGANPNTYSGETPSPLAAAAGLYESPETAKLLIDHGARVVGSGALAAAAMKGQVDSVKMLLDHGADVNDPGEVPGRPLPFLAVHCAVQQQHMDVLRILVERGADLEMKDSAGKTPLMIAEEVGSKDAMEILTPES